MGRAQEDVDAALADLEPVTLTYQPGGSSAESVTAANGLAFREYVEERSGGKITLETTWGQAIAPYGELVDALNDGRVDIAYHAAIYFPDEFPTVDAFSKITQYSTPAPLTGEAISAAMMSELAWNSDEHLQTIEDQGLVPLSPLMSSGDYWTACGKLGNHRCRTGRAGRSGSRAPRTRSWRTRSAPARCRWSTARRMRPSSGTPSTAPSSSLRSPVPPVCSKWLRTSRTSPSSA